MVGQTLLDTNGIGLLHDVQLDYYGKRAAAATADNTVHIWTVEDGQQKPSGQLKGHDGPVWKVSWAHPKFGSLLATCGYDMKVIVWKETPVYSGQWQIAFMDTSHAASVNNVQFCPWEYGLHLACASSDGTVSILSHSADQQWRRIAFPAHPAGAQALSWMPAQQREGVMATIRLVSGGCDNTVKVWRSTDGENWSQDALQMPAPTHGDWVRAVACSHTDSGALVATGGWDKTVMIWAQETEGQPWRQVCKLAVGGKVEGLSWSVTGSTLAVAFGRDVVLYKETYDGRFEEVGKGDESGFTEVQPPPTSTTPAANIPSNVEAVNAVAAAFGHSVEEKPNQLAAQQQSVMDSFGGF